MTCCEGESAVSTSSPMALALMFSMSCLTTRKLTSASSSARRISRSALSMFSDLQRLERREHFLAHGLGLDVFDELFDNPEIDVGLQQRQADLAQRALHVFSRELAFAPQVLEDPLQFFR